MLDIFAEMDSDGRGGDGLVAALDRVEARLLWALRRTALLQPFGTARCHAVHIALQQDFGEAGLGIEHLLRCIVVGLTRLSTRQLVIGEPGCGLVLPDEAGLLAVVRGSAGPGVLAAITGSPAAARLMPLFSAVAALVPQK